MYSSTVHVQKIELVSSIFFKKYYHLILKKEIYSTFTKPLQERLAEIFIKC